MRRDANEAVSRRWTMAMSTTTIDHFNLARFVDAQAATYATALAEIRRGKKQSHWMWFIFPQFYGLGTSAMANHYAIRSTAEAVGFLADPVLGARYRECVAALQRLDKPDPVAVFGPIDARKLHSSLTLFDAVDPGALFAAALDRWFGGKRDPETLRLIHDEQRIPD